MVERFSDGARRAMSVANQFIGSEHILLGIVDNDADAATAILTKLGDEPAAIRKQVEKRIKSGAETDTKENLPLTPFTKVVIEKAIFEARALGSQYVGTEHLLLGILCVEDCSAAQILASMGIKANAVREEVAARREGAVLARSVAAAPEQSPNTPFKRSVSKAFEEAHNLGHTLQAEHLLLGLLRAKFGITADQLRQEVLRLMDQQAGSGKESPSV